MENGEAIQKIGELRRHGADEKGGEVTAALGKDSLTNICYITLTVRSTNKDANTIITFVAVIFCVLQFSILCYIVKICRRFN